MKRPQTSALYRFNAFLDFSAFVLYVVGFASHTWLSLDFKLPPQPPTILENIPVEANMGLYTACKKIHYPSPSGEKIEEECSPDGAADWQFLAAGLAIAGLVLCFLGCVLTLYTVFCKTKRCAKFLITCCNFISTGLMVAPLLMYAINRKFQVKPPLPYIYDFDLAWGYFVSASCACLLAIVTFFNIIDIIGSDTELEQEHKDFKVHHMAPVINELTQVQAKLENA